MNKPQNHGLRTTGTHTGNFGRSKVQGKRGQLDLTKEILNRESLRIPNREEAYSRLQEAYEKTNDKKLRKFLSEELAKYRAQRQLYAGVVVAGGTRVTPVDADLDPKGRFKDFGTNYSTMDRDSAYDYIHRV